MGTWGRRIRRPGSGGWLGNSILRDFVAKVAARDAQAARRFGLRPVCALERSQNQRLLRLSEKVPKIINLGEQRGKRGRLTGSVAIASGNGGAVQGGGKAVGMQLVAGGKDRRAFNQVAQFADVAGEVVGDQSVERRRRQLAVRNFE